MKIRKQPTAKLPKKTKAQIRAGEYLELSSFLHLLITEQRCPVMFEGRLAYVKCPGVSKEAFKLAVDRRVSANLLAMLDRPSTAEAKP